VAYRRLSNREWELVQECFPKQHMGRPRQWSDRDCLDGVLYVLHTGCRWEELPKEFPPKSTVYDRYVFWVERQVFQKVLSRLNKRLPISKIFHLDSTIRPAKKGPTDFQSGQNQRQQNKSHRQRDRAATGT